MMLDKLIDIFNKDPSKLDEKVAEFKKYSNTYANGEPMGVSFFLVIKQSRLALALLLGYELTPSWIFASPEKIYKLVMLSTTYLKN